MSFTYSTCHEVIFVQIILFSFFHLLSYTNIGGALSLFSEYKQVNERNGQIYLHA